MIHSPPFPFALGTRLGVTFSIMIRSDKGPREHPPFRTPELPSIMNPAVTLPKSATLTKEVRPFLSALILGPNS
jgi:hypothetical protein